ncbi:MAG: class I SAM-dependent methyltransferase [Flavobacteriaceae bacterium]|nr:class I SAM-dependent methyltransferase [Flavobacteriaceae bacterium]
MKNRAINSESLKSRINENEKNQNVNINKWAFNIIPKKNINLKILELCSGIGRQSEYLSKHFKNSDFDFLDLSLDSLKIVENSSFFNPGRMNIINEDMDSYVNSTEKKYDIVFVSYGLYYSNNIKMLLKSIYQILNNEGIFIVMGPHGDNNYQIFEMVESTGLIIEDKIKYTCSKFMYDDVLNFALKEFDELNIYKVKNIIKWMNSSEFYNYWENSTFFDQNFKSKLIEKIDTFFEVNRHFINTKKIMLMIAKKK